MKVQTSFAFLLAFSMCALPAIGQISSRPDGTNYPYLLHIQTMNFDKQTCVLLRGDGEFHLEDERGNHTKVFEGPLSIERQLELRKIIDSNGLRTISQAQIPIPKAGILLDELRIHIFRGDHWQSIFFPDKASRKPFDSSIAPIVKWLELLPKEPHRELTEDEGKNECRIPKRIVLKRRKSADIENPEP